MDEARSGLTQSLDLEDTVMEMKKLTTFLGGLLLFAGVFPAMVVAQTITLNSSQKYQTINGWEATSEAGQMECSTFDLYKDEMMDRLVNELGINRIRLEIRSGVEHSTNYTKQFFDGQISLTDWKLNRYSTVNDNADPFVINPNGFHFDEMDQAIEEIVLPMRQHLQAMGENLFVNVNYVHFQSENYVHLSDPEEYAEFVLATYQHIQQKYGFVPDSWEVILEPEHSRWDGTAIGRAIVASAARLQAHGFTPNFVAPSVTNMLNFPTYFGDMAAVPGALQHVSLLSYHRYKGPTLEGLQAIAQIGQQYNKPIAMLERLAATYETLHQDLTVGNNVAWQQYGIGFCNGETGGDYYYADESNPQNPVVHIDTDSKYFRQYFRYIRRGAQRIGASTGDSALDPIAFVHPDGRYVVVVKTTGGSNFTVNGLPAGTYGIRYTTSAEAHANGGQVTIAQGQGLSASIPARGVVTLYATSGGGTPPPPPPPPTAPDLSLSKTSLSFGDVAVSSDKQLSFAIQNTGDAALSVTNITSSSARYTVSSTSGNVSAGGTLPITVTFSPTAAGSVPATLQIQSNDSDSPHQVTLSGTGTIAAAPQVTLSTSSLDFGDVEVGSSGDLTLTLENTGNAALDISGIISNSPRYTVDPTSGSVAAGGTLQLTVTFTPTAAGTVSGSLSIVSDASGSPHEVAVTGTGSVTSPGNQSPLLDFSPGSLAFGDVEVGETKDLTVSVENTGDATLNITDITVSEPEYTLSATSGAVAPGQSLELTVTFTPDAPGSLPAALIVVSDAPSSPDDLQITGNGTEQSTPPPPPPPVNVPEVTLTKSALDFGDLDVDDTQSLTFSVRNTGTGMLNVMGFSLDESAFSISPSSGKIDPSRQIEFTVTFAPTEGGEVLDTIQVLSNAASTPDLLLVRGNGVTLETPEPPPPPEEGEPQLSLSKTSLNFGQIVVDGSKKLSFVATNTGESELSISGVEGLTEPYSISPPTADLDVDASVTFEVTFEPAAEGTFAQTLSILSNADSSPDELSVTGSSFVEEAPPPPPTTPPPTTPPPPVTEPALAVNPAALHFGEVTIGSDKTLQFQITNSGAGTLIVSEIENQAEAFTTSPESGQLAAGEALTVSLGFSPSAPGVVRDTLRIVSNAAGSPHTIVVDGTGSIEGPPGGTSPALTVSTKRLEYGEIGTGGRKTLLFAISNPGESDLVIDRIEAGTDEFLASSDTAVVAAGQSTNVWVTFAPTEEGAVEDTLLIYSNAGEAPAEVQLAGGSRLLLPLPEMSASEIDFGAIFVGEAKTLTFSVENGGESRLIISEIVWTVDAFAVSPETAIIRAGDVVDFTITFAPNEDAEVHDTLKVYTNASTLPYVVPVHGDGDVRVSTADEAGPVAREFALNKNYPNPFSDRTWIGYSIPEAAHVVLTVYDLMGREVTRLVDGLQPAGDFDVEVDAAGWPSGAYIYRLSADGLQQTGKMVLIR